MTPGTGDDLHRLLAAKTSAAVQAAVESGGSVSAEAAAEIERLARLLEVHERETPVAPPPRAWAFAAVFVGTLVVLSALLFVRTRSTDIELDVDATRVGFVLTDDQDLFSNLDLTRLGASGVARVTLPSALTDQWDTGTLADPSTPIVIRVVDAAGRRGSIGVGRVRPLKGTSVDLRHGGGPGHYRLALRGPAAAVDIGIVGPVAVEVAGRETMLDLAAPKGIAVEPGGNLVLDFVLRDPANAPAASQIPLTNPTFHEVDLAGDREVEVLRTVSTVLAGTIFFESLGGKARQLRPGENLRFRRADGEARTLRLRSDRLSLGFHGNVSDMTSGDRHQHRSLMPSWLDLLRAQHALGLLWGSTVYIAGVTMAVYRWWRRT